MEWVLLIEMIIKMIQECQENRSSHDIEAGLNNPGILEYFACKRIVRKEMGLRGKALRQKAREGMGELQKLKPAEVQLLVSGDIEAFMESAT